MNKLITRVYNLCFLVFTTLTVAGCLGGGGGGSSSGLLGGGAGGITGGGVTGGGTAIANPEPASILLLGSGLIGMAIYAKARLKSKAKR